MDYEKEREIKIKIIGGIQESEEELGFEIDPSQECGIAEIVFNKIKGDLK